MQNMNFKIFSVVIFGIIGVMVAKEYKYDNSGCVTPYRNCLEIERCNDTLKNQTEKRRCIEYTCDRGWLTNCMIEMCKTIREDCFDKCRKQNKCCGHCVGTFAHCRSRNEHEYYEKECKNFEEKLGLVFVTRDDVCPPIRNLDDIFNFGSSSFLPPECGPVDYASLALKQIKPEISECEPKK